VTTTKYPVLLPKTNYPQRADLPALEQRIRRQWEELNLYAAIRRARSGRPKWILHDGPPYANGDVHVGTGQNKVLKDIVVKFRTMRGNDAPFVPGWDCHGLPIEHQILKELGEEKTLAAPSLRELCEQYAQRYVERQRRQFQELGVLADWDHPYLTLSADYELGVIEMFEQLVARGQVYRREKPIRWCVRHRTALADAEVEYRRLTSTAIYVAFPVVGAFNDLTDLDLIVWTTTPWTLPANVAVAVQAASKYVACRYKRNDPDGRRRDRIAILSRARYKSLAGPLDLGEIVAVFEGAELDGLQYHHPLWAHPCRVVLARYVAADEGSGVVHTAPGHGDEDFETGQAYGLPTLSPVDATGVYTADAREWGGRNVFDANPLIVLRLRDMGLLLNDATIEHEYPCCWRCKTPLIFRATPQWFISMSANDGRARARAAVERTQWVPSWGATRMRSMLSERPDWCISRQRAWGVPIPAFYCTACGKPDFDFPAVKALFARGGANAWFRTPVTAILPDGRRCACGGTTFTKETDIFDVWFESGASQHSVLDRDPTLAFPADVYFEGTDQHRGWFQASLLEGVLADNRVPFRAVVTNGFLVDARTGDKLSKSGYLISTDEVTGKYGADLFRLWIASLDFTDDIPFSAEILAARAPYYVKIRNTFRYLLGSTSDFDVVSDAVRYGDLLEIDRWALDALARVIDDVTRDFEAYQFHVAMQRLYNFCVVTMSATYFEIVKDRLYTFAAASPERRSAQTALDAVLESLVRMYAPVLVHSCEEVWEHLRVRSKEASVHLAAWPGPTDGWRDESLSAKYERLLPVRAAVNRALERLRESGAIGRSVDARVAIHIAAAALRELVATTDLASLCIVSEAVLAAEPIGGEDPECAGVWVHAERSPYRRCERCWARRSTVGSTAAFPELCDRCVRNVERV
jgi:isoleucyl-tRNA synthetase